MPLTKDKPVQVLIVEDEGLVAADVQNKLERLGCFAPVIASSGEEALAYARSASFDLVLMDIRLGGNMDGIATAQILKDELKLPVVYVTAHSDPHTVNRALATEPLGYVLKPIDDAKLSNTVKDSLRWREMERRVSVGGAAPSNTPVQQEEINFLRYRLEVASRWPESDHKRGVIERLSQRLAAAGS